MSILVLPIVVFILIALFAGIYLYSKKQGGK